VERIYRLIFLGLFVLGFVGAVASADFTGENNNDGVTVTESPVASLIRDMRLAQEINDLNKGRWNQDVQATNEDGLARVEELVNTQDQSQQALVNP
jgi:hypothetical protein